MDEDIIRGGGSLASLLRGGTGGGDSLVPVFTYEQNTDCKKPYNSYTPTSLGHGIDRISPSTEMAHL